MKEIIKKRKILFIIFLLIVITLITFFVLRNKMTAEETVSKFMYLVENKEYEKAKKMSTGDLENLELLSNIKPSNLTFKFSKDKKEAVAILLEEDIETTNMTVELKKTLIGWKIEDYKVSTGIIDPQIIEDRLKEGEEVSDIQLLHWGESDVSSKDEIAKYVKENGTVALIFIETMKSQKYDKANELYQPLSMEEVLTIEQLKKYDWNNYEIVNNFAILEGENGNLSAITIKLGKKELYIYVAGGTIQFITPSKT